MAFFKAAERPEPAFVPAYDVKIVGGKKIIIWRDKNNNNNNNNNGSSTNIRSSSSLDTSQYDRCNIAVWITGHTVQQMQ
jgi:hypothetical protein